MNENEYTISLISDEIFLLLKYKYNLKKTAMAIVLARQKGYTKRYYSILDEIERVVLEVKSLENQCAVIKAIEEEIKNSQVKPDETYLF